MGFLYANATSATRALLGIMLREKLHQLELHEVKFYNDQRVLNEQLVQVSSCAASCPMAQLCPHLTSPHLNSVNATLTVKIIGSPDEVAVL